MATNFGLNDSLDYNEFVLDSLTALNPKDGNYSSSNWPDFIRTEQLNNIAALKVLEVQLPFSFYVINSDNNTFYLRENADTLTSWSKVVMPIGNYTIDYLKQTLASSLVASSLNGRTYSVSYATETMKLTITSDSSHTFSIAMNSNIENGAQLFYDDTINQNTGRDNGFGFNPYRVYAENEINNPGLWFGFGSSVIYTSSSTSNSYMVSPNVFNVSGPDYVYVCSRALGPLFKMYLPGYGASGNVGGTDGPQIAKIPVLVNTGDIIFWQDPDPQKYFNANNTSLTSIDLYCSLGMNSEMTPLDFNGLGFSVKLGVLTASTTHNTALGGGVANNRVISKTWQT